MKNISEESCLNCSLQSTSRRIMNPHLLYPHDRSTFCAENIFVRNLRPSRSHTALWVYDGSVNCRLRHEYPWCKPLFSERFMWHGELQRIFAWFFENIQFDAIRQSIKTLPPVAWRVSWSSCMNSSCHTSPRNRTGFYKTEWHKPILLAQKRKKQHSPCFDHWLASSSLSLSGWLKQVDDLILRWDVADQTHSWMTPKRAWEDPAIFHHTFVIDRPLGQKNIFLWQLQNVFKSSDTRRAQSVVV